jgi:hypothetical protein
MKHYPYEGVAKIKSVRWHTEFRVLTNLYDRRQEWSENYHPLSLNAAPSQLGWPLNFDFVGCHFLDYSI